MRPTDTELHLSRLQEELLSLTAGTATETEIQYVVQQVLRDLKGSVSRESLPEMAARLAASRLEGAERHPLATL